MAQESIKIKPSILGGDKDLFQELFNKDEFSEMMRRITVSTFMLIRNIANNKLSTTADDYLDALDFQQRSRNQYTITFTGDASFLEEGYSSFDMKPGLLKNANVAKDGSRYKIIPISGAYTTSEDVRTSSDLRRGKKKNRLRSFNTKQNVNRIIKQVSKAKNTESVMFNLLGKKYRDKQSRGTSTNKIFRTVSSKSSSNSWMHPGFRGVKAFDKAEKRIDYIIDKVADEVIGQMFN